MYVDSPTDIELVRAREIARMLGVSPTHVYKLSEAGEIPSYRIGGAVRFDRHEVLSSLHSFHSEPMALAAGGDE